MMPEVIRSRLLQDVPHGFLGRRSGVSQGLCWGLNVGHGSGDDAQAIAANRALAVEAVAPGAQLVTVYQVHSADSVRVTGPIPFEQRPRADAMVTDRPGLALGIVTADCTPVLFADADAGVIGAVHAGWRGALSGIVEATVGQMRELGARRIAAAVGPTIARRSYEVDDAFHGQFLQKDPAHERFFSGGRPGHHQFDLEGFVVARIAATGIDRIEALGLDTYSDEDRFFSFRRATHRGEPNYGRQISLIALPG
jgi:YfiH family protein